MFEQMVAEARNITPQVDEGAQHNAYFADLIAASLQDKLEPLKQLSPFTVSALGDTATVSFKRPVGGKKVKVVVAIDYNPEGFAKIWGMVGTGDVNAQPVIFDIDEDSVDSVIDNVLHRHREGFQTLIAAWVK